MNYSTNNSMKVYRNIKAGKPIRQIEKPSRIEIDQYKQGFADGFSKGYESALKNNAKMFAR